MAKWEDVVSLVELLGTVPSGRMTVSVGGEPLVTMDADSKTLEVDLEKAKKAGLDVSEIIRVEGGRTASIRGSVNVAGALSHLGWRLDLYSGGERVVSLGKGHSRLTGYVGFNPLRLKKILGLLK